MKRLITLATLFSLVLAASALSSEPTVSITKNLTSMPLAFTENQGQWDEKVQFRADAGGAAMWFTTDGAYYQFTRRIPGDESESAPPRLSGAVEPDRLDQKPNSVETMMIKASFVGARSDPRMIGEDALQYKCNYFIGNDPAGWRTDVANYSAVIYEEVYPGIDLKYYGNGRQMEYDFIVSPGADPSQIKIQYEGVKTLSINGDGELVVETQWGEVIERRPVVYQSVDGTRVPIEGRYEIFANNSFSFSFSSDYDPALALVIDPVLSYGTYLGGNGDDRSGGIAVDTAGAAYVTGETSSTDFPTESWYQETRRGMYDVFVTKLSADGNSLVYSTYLGGNGDDVGYGIAVDSAGAAYVTGMTFSSDFPTESWYQETHQGGFWDAFVAKLSVTGNSLVYSTYLGGNGDDHGKGIAVDASGAAYVTGYTVSTDFPTESWYQETLLGELDAFVTKLNADGNSLVYSTYLGGSSQEWARAIAVDALGSAYVTGYTHSSDFPTQSWFQETHQGGIEDVFVTKLSAVGNSLVYSTYLGGNSVEFGDGITVDGSGCAYVTGQTYSADFPTQYPYQSNQGGYDVFVTKLSASGNNLVYSTYLGGGSDDGGMAIAVDAAGAAYVTGYTVSTDFPTESWYQETLLGGLDAFVTKLNADGNSLVYSTYLGGSGGDHGKAIAVDAAGAAYVTGRTSSPDFPTESWYQETYQGGSYDVFVTKLTHQEVGVSEDGNVTELPRHHSLSQNYPNPFNPTTTIEFSLPKRSQTVVTIYNVAGQKVRQLLNRELPAGDHVVRWDGCCDAGQRVATGVYLYHIDADGFKEAKKMVLLK